MKWHQDKPVPPTVLVTGATGSFGRWFLKTVLPLGWTVRAYSRDEYKQTLMADHLRGAPELHGVQADVRFLIGDVRDEARLKRAAQGCQIVVHAAALKQVPSCEYNPDECVKTNVVGSLNVVEACLDAGVAKAILLSSDKAVHPVNVYGASKLCAEKVWLAANSYATTQLSVVRYGNVRGSRGGVHGIPGPVQITDSRATRFWMDVQDAVNLVLLALDEMAGGEVFVPKLKASRVIDVVRADGDETGLRPGEKLHETLLSEEELGRTWDCGTHYRVCAYEPDGALRVPGEFRYTSEAAATA